MDQLLAILHQCYDSIFYGVIALSITALIFIGMERIYQVSSTKKTWRANLLDVQYALLSMLYPPFIFFILSAIFGFLAVQVKDASHNPDMSLGFFAVELLTVLFGRDCLIYLRHRIFHLRPVWPFHSVHHSSEEVNWISAARFHPAENVIETTGEILLFLAFQMAGVDAAVLSVAGLIIGFYNFFIHSNQRWTFGPLRYVLVSPVFHRWHHSDAPAATNKNFAAMFSCLDLLLGTFYMPKGVMPETLGLPAEEKPAYPRTMAGQLLHPFRKQ